MFFCNYLQLFLNLSLQKKIRINSNFKPDTMLEIIQKCYQNEHLSCQDHQAISNKHQQIKCGKGTFLLQEGDTLNRYYILMEGVVHSYVNDANGNRITIDLFQPGEVVIDVNALFQHKKTVENWQCLTDCTLLSITFEDFQELFHNIYGFREWGRNWMANALFEMKERSMEMITQTATERYARLIKQKPFLFNYVPLKYIASYLGVTDTSLSRIRKEYKNLK